MTKISWQKLVFNLSLLFCCTNLLVLSIEGFSSWREHNLRIHTAKKQARLAAIRSSQQIGKNLIKIQDTANAIASDLSSGQLTDEQLLARVKKELEKNPNLLAFGAAYKPFAYKPNIRLYAPYYTRKNGKIELRQTENLSDYTKPTPANEWYHKSLADGSIWVEPYFDQAFQETLIDYNVTFYRTDPQTQQKTPVGVIYANYSLNKLQELMNSLDLGKSGYGFILSQKGVYLAHPNQQYVKEQITIFDRARKRKDQKVWLIGEKAIKGERAVIDYTNGLTGEVSWAIVQPIPVAGWSMVAVVIKDEVLLDNQATRQRSIRITIEVIIFLFFLSILLFRADQGTTKSLWAISFTASILCVAGIGFIWYLVLSERGYKNNRNLLLTKPSVDNLLQPRIKLAEQVKQKPPVYIPTGVFVQAIKFNSANDVFVNGYIWQKYYDGIHDGLSRGFILPEGYELELDEAYRYKQNNTEVIGWYFEAVLRQNFNFSQYPFDANDVWIRLWPKDFNRNDLNREVILVPDLTSYDVINPLAQPGLEQDFVLEGWSIESSFFEYKFNNYNSNFGFENTLIKKNYPELYFTVILKRAFLGIFIARLVPLGVIAILLFVMMPLSREHGMEIVGACGGFIFIVILDQISVRGQLTTPGIIYFEYLYFVIYLFILLVAANAILLKLEKDIPFIQYQNNQIPKLLYWPTLLGILLIVTALTFY